MICGEFISVVHPKDVVEVDLPPFATYSYRM